MALGCTAFSTLIAPVCALSPHLFLYFSAFCTSVTSSFAFLPPRLAILSISLGFYPYQYHTDSCGQIACSDQGGTENCQTNIFTIDGGSTSGTNVYNLNTVGTQNMVVHNGNGGLARYSDNVNVFPDTIALFTG